MDLAVSTLSDQISATKDNNLLSGNDNGQNQKGKKIKPFACSLCEYRTDEPSKLEIHAKVHAGLIKPLKCKSCSFTTLKPFIMRSHAVCHSQTDFKCELCTFSTKYRKKFKCHMNLHHKMKPSIVELNNWEKEELMRKKNETHNCHICSFQSVTAEMLLEHIDCHIKDDSFYPKNKNKKKKNASTRLKEGHGLAEIKAALLSQHKINKKEGKSNVMQNRNVGNKTNSSLWQNENVGNETNLSLWQNQNVVNETNSSLGQNQNVENETTERKHCCNLCSYVGMSNKALKKHRKKHRMGESSQLRNENYSGETQDNTILESTSGNQRNEFFDKPTDSSNFSFRESSPSTATFNNYSRNEGESTFGIPEECSSYSMNDNNSDRHKNVLERCPSTMTGERSSGSGCNTSYNNPLNIERVNRPWMQRYPSNNDNLNINKGCTPLMSIQFSQNFAPNTRDDAPFVNRPCSPGKPRGHSSGLEKSTNFKDQLDTEEGYRPFTQREYPNVQTNTYDLNMEGSASFMPEDYFNSSSNNYDNSMPIQRDNFANMNQSSHNSNSIHLDIDESRRPSRTMTPYEQGYRSQMSEPFPPTLPSTSTFNDSIHGSHMPPAPYQALYSSNAAGSRMPQAPYSSNADRNYMPPAPYSSNAAGNCMPQAPYSSNAAGSYMPAAPYSSNAAGSHMPQAPYSSNADRSPAGSYMSAAPYSSNADRSRMPPAPYSSNAAESYMPAAPYLSNDDGSRMCPASFSSNDDGSHMPATAFSSDAAGYHMPAASFSSNGANNFRARNNERGYACRSCSFKTDSEEELDSHIRINHKTLKCNHCSFITATKKSLKIHKRYHTNKLSTT